MRLTTLGRRSGQPRVAIVGYYEDGPNLVTLAMNGWAEAEPAWWLNLQAQPETSGRAEGWSTCRSSPRRGGSGARAAVGQLPRLPRLGRRPRRARRRASDGAGGGRARAARSRLTGGASELGLGAVSSLGPGRGSGSSSNDNDDGSSVVRSFSTRRSAPRRGRADRQPRFGCERNPRPTHAPHGSETSRPTRSTGSVSTSRPWRSRSFGPEPTRPSWSTRRRASDSRGRPDADPGVRQRRTAPAARPWMKLRWSTRKRSSGGRMAMAMPAKVSPWSVA